ncbi:hypothetical protein BpOF4_04445 [Alkalihalophilus pseudofirmus OF4]|uniref:Uncharacterized protein n=1 Tax=Alkalihalophilus pseudofirmus (strain ATCC BAA-2126 / JCM 17055 / OF4) TaxID=398511 RepID=D3FXW6_ALKPO|nr:hypothetical protein [Alkalihalophilus pseudofirmus]ADC48953.1 hypothetical protein BpOF4_04445 [Alkalihalophilus pseudofirmus OF4]
MKMKFYEGKPVITEDSEVLAMVGDTYIETADYKAERDRSAVARITSDHVNADKLSRAYGAALTYKTPESAAVYARLKGEFLAQYN